MPPNTSGYLGDLRQLADQLFHVVREEFTTGAPVIIQFERVDDLAETQVEEPQLVATALLCAQLLHRVTAEPANTHPRHVLTLSDIIEQVIPPLAAAVPGNPGAAKALLDVGGTIAEIAFQLTMLTDPGDTGFAD
jgi:hypothetical protein